MTGTTVARVGLAWVLSHAVHATIAAAAVEVLVRATRPSAAAAHRLWRMALVAPLLTASLFVVLDLGHRSAGLLPGSPLVLHVGDTPAAAAPSLPLPDSPLIHAVALAIAVGALAGVTRFAVRRRLFRRRLAGACRRADPRLHAALARLSGRFAVGEVQLTESAHLASPAAVGPRAICFPSHAVALIDEAQLDAVLAHELAHVERRDPQWFLGAGLVQAALWMHPLNHLVVARLRRSAEFACDERAVAVTGDPLGLARALDWFAHASLAMHVRSVQRWLPAAARNSKALVDRVRRLLTTDMVRAAAAQPASRRQLGATAALLALMVGAGSTLGITFPGDGRSPSAAELDASARRRMADLGGRQIDLEMEIHAAQPLASEGPNGGTALRLQQLEQDLRHVRAERAWLEQSLRQTNLP